MTREIWDNYRTLLTGFPTQRRPLIGAVIKGIRVDKGIRQIDFADKVGINISTLKSIENDHQEATTVENLARCSKELGVSIDEIILIGRERDPANYFVCKRTAPRVIRGIRERKKTPPEWRENIRLRFKDFDLSPISPPIVMRKDFFICRINLPPKRMIEKKYLLTNHRVLGFVSAGFNLKMQHAGKTTSLTTNQGFAMDGAVFNGLINDDEDHAAVIYLVTKLPDSEKTVSKESDGKDRDFIDIAYGIHKIRKEISDRRDRLISIQHLSDLTDSLNREQLMKLMRVKKGSAVIYWNKIEDLLSGTGIAMETFLRWCRHDDVRTFSLASATTRAVIDCSAYHAVKIYSAVPTDTNNEFFCGELFIEGKDTLGKKIWERKDAAMIALYVEDGEIEITVGKRRSPLPLLKGESIYFDGSLGYLLRNPGSVQAKAFFATCPAIQF